MSRLALKPTAHVVDVLGNVIGRDQPILRMEKAIEMVSLLGEDIFFDENVVFFDPFCKAGELLLACAFHSCWVKSKGKNKLLDVDMVMKEIYQSNRYFGLAPDERHHRLSTRTFLGNEHSHQQEFNHIIRDGHYLSEKDGTLDKEKFEKEFKSMIEYITKNAKSKKIVAVGNPPYQENDGGFGGSATAIYSHFAEALIDSNYINEFIIVIPSRWFSAGKGVDNFRDRIIASKEIKAIHHFKHSKTVFPTVDVLGGVCFFHYEKKFKGETVYVENGQETVVNFSKYDIVLDDPMGYPLVDKVLKNWKGKFVGQVAWSGKPFGIRTFYFKRNSNLTSDNKNAIGCYSKGRRVLYANLKDIDKNTDKINEWKVAVPRAYSPGSKMGVRRVTLPKNQYFIIPKGYITTETYNIVASFKSKQEATNFLIYLQTDFARYFLGLRKITQDIPKDRWNWVPYIDVSKEWTDKELALHFKLTKAEQEHIKNKVQEWS